MIRVDLPEHKTFVNFPDGTDPAEIERVLRTNFPSKQPGGGEATPQPKAVTSNRAASGLSVAVSSTGEQSFPMTDALIQTKDRDPLLGNIPLGQNVFGDQGDPRTKAMQIATPEDRAFAKKVREAITGIDRPRPHVETTPELRAAKPLNIFEKGLTVMRRALSPYDTTEAMDPGQIAAAQIAREAGQEILPARREVWGDKTVNLPARGLTVPEYKQHVVPENEGLRVAERFMSGVPQGVKAVGTGILGAAEWMGSETAGKAASAIEADEISHRQDTGLSGELGAGFGSMLTFLVPSMGVSKAMSLVTKLSGTAAKVGGAASMAGFEAATEAGSVYRDMLKRGHSSEDASTAATKTFVANLPLNFLTDKAAFFPKHAADTAIKRGLNSAVTEGLQESGQEYISERSQPDIKVDPAAILKAGAIGAITGGVTGAGQHGLERLGAAELRRRESNLKALVFDSDGSMKNNAPEASIRTLEAVQGALANLEGEIQVTGPERETALPETRPNFAPSGEVLPNFGDNTEPIQNGLNIQPAEEVLTEEGTVQGRKASILQKAAATIAPVEPAVGDLNTGTAKQPGIFPESTEIPVTSEGMRTAQTPDNQGLNESFTPGNQEAAIIPEPETNLKPAQKELVRDLVREYGSVEAAHQAHTTESDMDRFARYEAAKIFTGQGKAVTEAAGTQEMGKAAAVTLENLVPQNRGTTEQPETVTPAHAEVRQPWQMTREEYVDNFSFEPRPGVKEKAWRQEDRMKAGLVHKTEVQAALSEGLPVPPEVLAEYPELAPKRKDVSAEKAPAWYINAEDRPVLTTKADATGYRGPYSKQEVSELTGTDMGALDKAEQGKPVHTEEYPDPQAKASKIHALPAVWKMEVGKTRTKEGHTFEAEVDWHGKRLVFSEQKHMDNPEIVNHEVAHVRIETLPETKRDALFDEYVKAAGLDEWTVKNNFHHEKIAMDYGDYLTNPDSTPKELKAVFDKHLAAATTEPGHNDTIPDHVTRAVEESREAPTAGGVTTKRQTKDIRKQRVEEFKQKYGYAEETVTPEVSSQPAATTTDPDFNGLLDSLQKQIDYQAWLNKNSPSNMGRKRSEVISALEIETGRNTRKRMDPYRQKILENIRRDHAANIPETQQKTAQEETAQVATSETKTEPITRTEPENPIFTKDAYQKAKARMKARLSQQQAERETPGKPASAKQKDTGVILDTLGLQQIYERLASSKTVKAAMADLKTLGAHVFAKGATTWKAWFNGMKEHLGKLWDRFRPHMEKVFGEISKPAKQTAGRDGRFTFSNEEVENGIQRNRKGIRGQSLASQLTEAAKDFAHGFTRLYKPLPRDTFFAEANKIFSDLEASKGVASGGVQKKIIAVMGNMDEMSADLFTKALVINDAMETLEIVKEHGEKFRYPFGITEENIEGLKSEVDTALEAAPNVKEAVNRYYQTTKELNERFTEAAKALGVYGTDKTFQRNRYFHHMVMRYADKSRGTKGGADLKTRIFRDNFRKRYGSIGDINTNAVQVTFKTWAQMESDIRRMELYKELKDKYDLMPTLKKQMRNMRHRIMKGLAARVGFMDETLSGKVTRLWEIGVEKAEAFDAPDFKESTIVKLDNEFREATKEIQQGIDAYRRKLLDPDFYAKEYERFREEWGEKKDEPFPEEVGDEVFAISVRRLTAFQLALMNGDIKPFIKPLLEKAAGGREYRLASVQDHFYRTKTIAQDMIEELLLDVAGDVIGKEHLKEILVKADPDVWVLPAEIVQTFDHIKNQAIAQSTKGKRFVHIIGAAMKRWWLFAPHNVIRYISNNTVGDTSFLFAVAPKAAVGSYLKESVGILRKMSNLSPDTAVDEQRKADINHFFRKGGEGVGITVQEIPRSNTHKTLKAFQQRGWLERIADLPADYLDAVYGINTFTETSRRLAAYLYFLDKWRAGEKAYGASKRELIDGLVTIEDKAYQIANDALVNYAQISESGRNLGDVFLFWSFREGNFRRWYHLFRNIPMDENRARVILKNSGMLAGRSTAKLTGVALIRGAQTVVMLSILQAITTAFNWLFWPDEEDQLADEVRSKPHIIFGKDGNGKILYWESYDAATELLSWVGMDKWVKQFKGIKDGKVQDVVWDVMLAPINQTYGLWNPLLGKYATEVMLGKTGWPKIQDPRPIRDKLEYGAGIFGLVPEYRLLAGKPSEGYLKDRGKSLLVKRADTGQVAYYQANELVEDFLDKINKGKAYAEPDTPNARKKRDALYNLKLAIRYHDEDAQQKYGRLYTELGGTFKGLQQSIKMSHPLAAIPKKMQAAFLEGLSEDQGKTVARAVEWYGRIYGE